MAKIVVVGSLNMDLVAISPRLPQPGETIVGTRFLTEPGGKGANQAYAASRLGGDVAMLGRVGEDDHGRRMRSNLAAAGCDVRGVQTTAGASGTALILVAGSGQNSIVVVPGANHQYSPADIQRDEHLLTGAQYLLLQLEIPFDTVTIAAQMARQQGALVILDPAPAPHSLPLELLQSVHILTPNESEAGRLAGRPSQNLTLDEAQDIANHLMAAGVKIVVMKLGAQGCLLADGATITRIPAPPVKAVDTTAAGDVFNGALAVARSEGASLQDSCRFAVHAAALSVTRLGAQRSMPGRSELDSLLSGRASAG
jgi:ribokinase